MATARGTTTAERVVHLLEAVALTPGGVGIRSLARESGIDKSAVSRLLRHLNELGFIEATDGKYVTGPRLNALARAVAARDMLVEAVRPLLQRLADKSAETVCLAELSGDEIVYRDVIESSRPLRYVVPIGVGAPLHAGAGGRAILAGLRDEERESYIRSRKLTAITSATIVDRAALRRTVLADRERGYSVSHGERFSDGTAVGSAFHWAGGSCGGAIVVAFPSARLGEHDLDALGAAVAGAAHELSVRLGASVGE